MAETTKTALQKRCEELLPVIQAGAEGKEIEWSFQGSSWTKKSPETTEFSAEAMYRIKPVPKYRPFTPEEAVALGQRGVHMKAPEHPCKEVLLGVTTYDGRAMFSVGENRFISPEFLLEKYEFWDGTPCGVQSE